MEDSYSLILGDGKKKKLPKKCVQYSDVLMDMRTSIQDGDDTMAILFPDFSQKEWSIARQLLENEWTIENVQERLASIRGKKGKLKKINSANQAMTMAHKNIASLLKSDASEVIKIADFLHMKPTLQKIVAFTKEHPQKMLNVTMHPNSNFYLVRKIAKQSKKLVTDITLHALPQCTFSHSYLRNQKPSWYTYSKNTEKWNNIRIYVTAAGSGFCIENIKEQRILFSQRNKHNFPVRLVRLSKKLTQAISADRYSLMVWDLVTKKCVASHKTEAEIVDIAITENLNYFAIVYGNNTVGLHKFNAKTPGKIVLKHLFKCNQKPSAVALHPSDRLLAIAPYGYDNNIDLYHIPSAKYFAAIRHRANLIHTIAFNPDGTSLGYKTIDNAYGIWSLGELTTQPMKEFIQKNPYFEQQCLMLLAKKAYENSNPLSLRDKSEYAEIYKSLPEKIQTALIHAYDIKLPYTWYRYSHLPKKMRQSLQKAGEIFLVSLLLGMIFYTIMDNRYEYTPEINFLSRAY